WKKDGQERLWMVSDLEQEQSLRYNSEISFHRFPVDTEVRARWLTQIRRDNFSPLQSTHVCSWHFNTGDFVVTAVGKRKLNQGAVPCLFAWNDYSMPAPRLNVWQRRPRCPSLVLAASDTDQEMEVQIAPDHDYSVTPTTSAMADALANENEALKLQHQLEASQLQSRFGLQRLSGSDEDIRFYTRCASKMCTNSVSSFELCAYSAPLLLVKRYLTFVPLWGIPGAGILEAGAAVTPSLRLHGARRFVAIPAYPSRPKLSNSISSYLGTGIELAGPAPLADGRTTHDYMHADRVLNTTSPSPKTAVVSYQTVME
ncbi:hypothetical protein NFI96_009299, partial [Prochilodus magdalenae]